MVVGIFLGLEIYESFAIFFNTKITLEENIFLAEASSAEENG